MCQVKSSPLPRRKKREWTNTPDYSCGTTSRHDSEVQIHTRITCPRARADRHPLAQETTENLKHIIQKNIGITSIITSCSVPFHHLPAPCMYHPLSEKSPQIVDICITLVQSKPSANFQLLLVYNENKIKYPKTPPSPFSFYSFLGNRWGNNKVSTPPAAHGDVLQTYRPPLPHHGHGYPQHYGTTTPPAPQKTHAHPQG